MDLKLIPGHVVVRINVLTKETAVWIIEHSGRPVWLYDRAVPSSCSPVIVHGVGKHTEGFEWIDLGDMSNMMFSLGELFGKEALKNYI